MADLKPWAQIELTQTDLAKLPSSYSEATRTNAPRYFTGKPCKHGHIAWRYTKACGSCSECFKVTQASYRERHAQKRRASYKAYSETHPEKSAERQRRYRKRKPEVRRAAFARHRATLLMATPKWLTPLQKLDMRRIYLRATLLQKLTGRGFDVDHIEPLRGVDRSGLHVPWNLQVLPDRDNRKKSNKTL